MSLEAILLSVVIVLLVLLFGYIWLLDRNRRKQQEQWEDEVYELFDKVRKKLEHMDEVHIKKITEEMNRVDDNMQRRHNYLKKSYNDIADRLDTIEKMEKGVKDLYYQYEKSNARLNEIVALLPKSAKGEDNSQDEAESNVTVLDEDVVKVLKLYEQGVSVEEIARQLGRAIPEIQLMIQIFANNLNEPR